MARSQPNPAAARARLGPFLNTLIVAGGYLLSRVLGLARDIIISAQFGTRPELDAYRATFNILDLIYLVVAGGALGSAFIPVFAGFVAEQREDNAWRLAGSLLNWVLIALLAACVLIALLADPLVALTVGSGFDPPKRALTAQILRLLLIQPVLLGLGGLAKATLESFDQFTLPAIGANLYNIGIIGGALLAHWLGVGARYTPVLRLDTPGLRQVGRLLGPRLFGQSAWQINMIAIASFASLLGNGAVAANGYALQLMLLPHGLIALSLGTVMFPQLARHYAAGDMAALRAAALAGVRSVLFLALPAAALLAILRLPVLRLLYQRGQFDATSTALTAGALGFYALGLVAFAAAEILVRTFYAMHDTRTPVYVGIGAVLLNIGLGWSLLRIRPNLGMLALAFSIANTSEAIALVWLLRPRLGQLGGDFWRAFICMLAATLACAVTLLALLWISQPALPFLREGDTYRWPVDFVSLALWLAGAGALGMLVYGGVALALRLEEIRATLRRVRGLLVRLRGFRGG